ncbi:pseudouridine synthase [Pelagophyceae sp. CCMP2097]|nr:pseudouridine synthase [Pelagophyceae sp. CCMP2097]|mmetsp:Transcript_30299/g.104637  ORF Transcript_30299/g.104637 Transcript_30299/m.104637 type:complete len:310 (+) Transcript_30299:191-1120(+)
MSAAFVGDDSIPRVGVLYEHVRFAVVNKPGGLPCHAPEQRGPRRRRGARCESDAPLLQRARETLMRRVNLVHRLDRGASGCVLVAFDGEATEALAAALKGAIKTYVAFTRGRWFDVGAEAVNVGRPRGWFVEDRPIKDERGVVHDTETMFLFAGATPEDSVERASLVLCRPKTGRWHQIRRHLNGLAHPILGDGPHGDVRTNREWHARNLPRERLCLHLARLQLPATALTPAVDVHCPLPADLEFILRHHMPTIYAQAKAALEDEARITLDDDTEGQDPKTAKLSQEPSPSSQEPPAEAPPALPECLGS